jgi:hypothetical protein
MTEFVATFAKTTYRCVRFDAASEAEAEKMAEAMRTALEQDLGDAAEVAVRDVHRPRKDRTCR